MQEIKLPALIKKNNSITQCFSPKYRKVVKKNEIYSNQISQNEKEQLNLLKQKDPSQFQLQKNYLKRYISNVDNEGRLQQKLKKINSEHCIQAKKDFDSRLNQIKAIFFQLNLMIDKNGNFYEERMKTHENEIIKIVCRQIKMIHQQCQKAMLRYNQLIKRAKNNEQLAQTRQEVQYFKQSALQINSENKCLKLEIKQLKNKILNMEIQIKNQRSVVKNLSYKLSKYKILNSQKKKKICLIQQKSNQTTKLLNSVQLQKSLSFTSQTKGDSSRRDVQTVKSRINCSLTPVYSLIKNSKNASPLALSKFKLEKSQKLCESSVQDDIGIRLNTQNDKGIRLDNQNDREIRLNTQNEIRAKFKYIKE